MQSPVNKNRFTGYYSAKFAREARAHPAHWLILPCGPGWYELKQVRGFDAKPAE